MSRLLIVLAAVMLASMPARAEQRCDPIPGADTLWSQPATRFLFVGELHGTLEAPAIFGDLVCAAAQSAHRPIIVSIEHSAAGQPALDAFLSSSGNAAATRRLARQPDWSGAYQDGRESVAYFALVRQLRVLKAAGRILRVVDFVPDDEASDNNPGMAANLRAAANAVPNALVLVLVGNAHAAKGAAHPGMAAGAAGYLPAGQTVTLLIVDRGGMAWNCQSSCGPHPMAATSRAPRGVVFGPAWLSGYDGMLVTGAPSTASPPLAHTD